MEPMVYVEKISFSVTTGIAKSSLQDVTLLPPGLCMGSLPDICGQSILDEVLVLVFVPSHVYEIVIFPWRVAFGIEVEDHGLAVSGCGPGSDRFNDFVSIQ